MGVDRALSDVENFANLKSRLALCGPPQNLALAKCQRTVCRLRRRGLQEFPFTFSPRQRKLMGPRDLQHLLCAADGYRVGAQYKHRLKQKRLVKRVFVVAKVLKIPGVEPERVAAHSHSVIAFGQRAAQFLVPASHNSCEAELIAFEVPFATRNDFQVPDCQVSIEIRKAPA